MAERVYLTTTLPYVNADPHIGHALEFVQADIIVRHQRLLGKEVFFNTGTDEHGQKVHTKARELGKNSQEYVDEYAERWKGVLDKLNIENYNFTRTTNPKHKKAAQGFWKICDEKGFIGKRQQKVKYCVGCELEKTDSELTRDRRCPIHPSLEIEVREEENYFFKFSEFGGKLLDLYNSTPNFVVPESRFHEIRTFVERGLSDFSISRLKSKMPWGVPVPGDDEHIMYVWFDALVNYISAIGWPGDIENFEKWWPVVQVAGKDNLRQQAAMWQAMLLSVDLPPSRQIVIHGFITSGGQKMSKTLGNVIDPLQLVDEYGTDALRYFLTREVNTFEDSDITHERFKEAYNANLANGLGNLVARIMKMAETYRVRVPDTGHNRRYEEAGSIVVLPEGGESAIYENLDNFNIQAAADSVWHAIKLLDGDIQELEPFKKIKTNPEEAKADVRMMLSRLLDIAIVLEPFLPETSRKVKEVISANKMPEEALFPRVD